MNIPYTVEARHDTGMNNGRMGMWLFIASEIMLFGGLFSAYALLRVNSTDWLHGPDVLNVVGAAVKERVPSTSTVSVDNLRAESTPEPSSIVFRVDVTPSKSNFNRDV